MFARLGTSHDPNDVAPDFREEVGILLVPDGQFWLARTR